MADVGRPTVMTNEVFAKLEEAFLNGASDKEAYFLAGISKDAFYNYIKQNPEYNDRIDGLRESVKYVARRNVVKAIKEEDKQLSQWYLERKGKDEFAQRTETTGKEGKDLHGLVTDEDIALAKIINEQRRNSTTNSESKGVDSKPLDGEVSNQE